MNGNLLEPVKVTTSLSVLLMILILGIWIMKDFNFSDDGRSVNNSFFVVIKHFGRDAKEMEKSITIPLENVLRSVRGIEHIFSRSELGATRIELKMLRNYSYANAYLDIRDGVYQIYSQLPSSVQKPEIYSGSNSSTPSMIISLSSTNMDRKELEIYANDLIKPTFEKIQEAGEIQLGGAGAQELTIRLNSSVSALYGIDPQSFGSLLQDQYIHGNIGNLLNPTELVPILFQGRIHTIADILALRFSNHSGSTIPIREMIQIEESIQELESISRINGENGLVFYLKQSGQGSSIGLSLNVNRTIKELNNGDVDFEILFDRGNELLDAIKLFSMNIFTSMFIVGLFTYLGLRNLYSSLLVTLSLPFYAFLSLTLLHTFRIPIGLSTLMGIGLAVGAVADSGIIIADSMTNNLQSKKGISKNLTASLVFSGLTTVIVTIPLLLSEHISLDVQKIALSFFIFISTSTLFNLVFIPSFISFAKTSNRKNSLEVIKILRKPILKILQLRSWVVNPIALSLFVITMFGVIFIPKSLSSYISDSLVSAHVELPSGSSLSAVDNSLQRIEYNLKKIPGIITIESHARRENGSISIQYDPDLITKKQIINLIEQQNDYIRDTSIFVQSGHDSLRSIPISIKGPDSDVLITIVKTIGEVFGTEEWVRSVIYHFKEGGPVWTFRSFPDRLLSSGLTAASLNETLHWALHGPVSLKWFNNEKEQDIRIYGAEQLQMNIETLKNIPIRTQSGSLIPIRELGTFTLTEDNRPIFRQNLQRSIDFSIQTDERDLEKLFSSIQQIFLENPLPSGYRFDIETQLIEEQNELNTLLIMVFISFILIYLTLATEFESFSLPLLLIATIPISLFLPVIVIGLVKIPFTTHVFVGFIIVIGIVVNNSIIITERVNAGYSSQMRTFYLKYQIYKSVLSRLNGILMTTGSTCIGLIPLIYGWGIVNEQIQHLSLVVFLGVCGSFLCGIFVYPSILFSHLQKKIRKSI